MINDHIICFRYLRNGLPSKSIVMVRPGTGPNHYKYSKNSISSLFLVFLCALSGPFVYFHSSILSGTSSGKGEKLEAIIRLPAELTTGILFVTA